MPDQEGAVDDPVDSRRVSEAVELDPVLEQEKRLEGVEGIDRLVVLVEDQGEDLKVLEDVVQAHVVVLA